MIIATYKTPEEVIEDHDKLKRQGYRIDQEETIKRGINNGKDIVIVYRREEK